MMRVKIKNLEKFKSQLRGRVGPTLASNIQKRIAERFKTIVPELFVAELQTSHTYKGLAGLYAGDTTGKDLCAEFGLSDSNASDILHEIIAVIESSFIIRRDSKAGNILHIELNEDKLSKIYQIAGTSYYSYPNPGTTSHYIPWLEWVMGKEPANISDAGILYGPFKSSRSGRALMFDDSNAIYKWSYVPAEQPNFIDHVFSTSSFKASINRSYLLALKDEIASRGIG